MDEKAYAMYQVRNGYFAIVSSGNGFPIELATILQLYPAPTNCDIALAKFYRSGDKEQNDVELHPMPGSEYTRGSFSWEQHMGIAVIVGRYW